MRVMLILSSEADRVLLGLRNGISAANADIRPFEMEGLVKLFGLGLGVTIWMTKLVRREIMQT